MDQSSVSLSIASEVYGSARTRVGLIGVYGAFASVTDAADPEMRVSANGLFTCTRRYQPVRSIWAILRASFLSVLLRIASSAACTPRASMQTIG